MSCGWRIGYPDIFTELCRQHEIRIIIRLKKDIHPKWNLLNASIRHPPWKHLHGIASRCKPPCFVKLTIIWKISFRNDGKDTAILQNHSTVIELLLHHHRSPDDSYHRESFCSFPENIQCRTSLLDKKCLMKKIRTCVGRKHQFRKYDKTCSMPLRLLDTEPHSLCIVFDIAYLYLRCCNRNPDKTLYIHKVPPNRKGRGHRHSLYNYKLSQSVFSTE